MAAFGLRTWLRIIHFALRLMLCVITVPGVVNPATSAFPRPLGSGAFRTFPQFDSVAPREGLGERFEPPLNHLAANATRLRRWFDWSFAPIPKFNDRFARQNRFEPPPEFPLASPYSGIVHHLSGPNSYALTRILR